MRLHPLPSRLQGTAARHLAEELTATETVFPGAVWPDGQHSLMKSPGTNGCSSSSKAAVPVAGRSEFMSAAPLEFQPGSDHVTSPECWPHSTVPVLVAQTFATPSMHVLLGLFRFAVAENDEVVRLAGLSGRWFRPAPASR